MSKDLKSNINYDLDYITGQLMKDQNERRFTIRQQGQCNNSALAYIRTKLGFTVDLEENERKKIASRALAIKKAIEEFKPPPESIDVSLISIILDCVKARAVWDERREAVENRMVELAAQTPGAAFVARTPGFGMKGLAVIIGEVGNLSNYPTKGHLWTRLGLGVRDGKRQGSIPAGLEREARAEAWIDRKYSPHRRAEVYAFIDDTMFKHQKPGTVYRDYYERKKAEYLARGKDEIRYPDRSARRAMSKMIIRDLWSSWNAAVKNPKAHPIGKPLNANSKIVTLMQKEGFVIADRTSQAVVFRDDSGREVVAKTRAQWVFGDKEGRGVEALAAVL